MEGVWKLAVSHGVTVPVISCLPNDVSDQYCAMLVAPVNTTFWTSDCRNGVAGATAGGVGWKLSRMTSVDAVLAAVTSVAAATSRAGGSARTATESGAMPVVFGSPVTETRIPDLSSFGEIAISSSLRSPLSCSSVQMKRLSPPSK